MSSLIVYEQIKKLQDELNKKLDEIKFKVAMEDVSNTIDDMKVKINSLEKINIDKLTDKLDLLASIDSSKITDLNNLLDEYEKATDQPDAVLEEKINKAILESGVLSKFRDDLVALMDSYKAEIISKIKIPVKLKDVEIGQEGMLVISGDIVDVLDFEIPIYKYDEKGNVIIKCIVTPNFTTDGIKIDLDQSTMDDLGFEDGFNGYFTSIQILTNIKE